MPAAMQVIHRLDGEENDEVDLGSLLGIGKAEIQLAAALDDFLDELIDRVLVAVCKAGDRAPDFLSNPADEPRGRRVLRVFGRSREQITQIAFVEVGVIDAVVLALLPVMLAERLAQAPQRI